MKKEKTLVSEEDLFQKSLRGESEFYKGLEKFSRRGVWSFFFAAIMVFFVFFNALFGVALLIKLVLDTVREKAFSMIPGAIFLSIIVAIANSAVFTMLKKLNGVFEAKNMEFKIKTAALLILPAAFFVLVFILVLPVILFMKTRL